MFAGTELFILVELFETNKQFLMQPVFKRVSLCGHQFYSQHSSVHGPKQMGTHSPACTDYEFFVQASPNICYLRITTKDWFKIFTYPLWPN